MANAEHVAILKQGIEAWDHWRKEHAEIAPDLSREDLRGIDFTVPFVSGLYRWMDLSGVDLHEANLFGTDLRRVKFCNANLRGADLRSANLNGGNGTLSNTGGAILWKADLSNANLGGAQLARAQLEEANLTGADLSLVNLTQAELSGADLRGARLFGAVFNLTGLKGSDFRGAKIAAGTFDNVDLSEVAGLTEVTHDAPSTIGIDTFYRSQGNIPEAFLRGAGVPETFITFARSLVGQAIQFYSCFISYSSKDGDFTDRLHADLRAKDLRVWFAPEDLKIGDRFHERIEESIRLYDKVMIVLSEASVKSRWVEREVNAALEREDREKRTVLFPIRIDDAIMEAPQPWAADIRRSRHIGDFRGWKGHDSYHKALGRLLRDLESEKEPEALRPQDRPLNG